MFALYILELGVVLQFLLVFRGVRSGNIKRFPFFFVYIGSGIFQSLIDYYFFLEHPENYAAVFWPIQFISLFIGCGVVLEIFGHVLARYPGAKKFAKSVYVVTFSLVFVSAVLYVRFVPSATLAGSEVELERNLRTVQSIGLMGVLGAILHYRIRLGKTMRGMIIGYGIYLGTSLVALAIRLTFGAKADIWRTIRPFSFEIALAVWVVSLWAYYPDPVPNRIPSASAEYEALASATRRALGNVRSYLGRSVRP